MIIDPYKLSFFPLKIIIEWNCSGEPELNFPIFGQFRHLCRYQMSCKPSLANIARTLRRLPVFTTIHCYSTKSKVKVLINKKILEPFKHSHSSFGTSGLKSYHLATGRVLLWWYIFLWQFESIVLVRVKRQHVACSLPFPASFYTDFCALITNFQNDRLAKSKTGNTPELPNKRGRTSRICGKGETTLPWQQQSFQLTMLVSC